jgi:hypothetical protein
MAMRWPAGKDGIALFERIRYRLHDGSVFCMAFDLIEVNGDDMPRVMQAAEATLTLYPVKARSQYAEMQANTIAVRFYWTEKLKCREQRHASSRSFIITWNHRSTSLSNLLRVSPAMPTIRIGPPRWDLLMRSAMRSFLRKWLT